MRCTHKCGDISWEPFICSVTMVIGDACLGFCDDGPVTSVPSVDTTYGGMDPFLIESSEREGAYHVVCLDLVMYVRNLNMHELDFNYRRGHLSEFGIHWDRRAVEASLLELRMFL